MSFTLLMMVTAGIAAGAGYLAARRSAPAEKQLKNKDQDVDKRSDKKGDDLGAGLVAKKKSAPIERDKREDEPKKKAKATLPKRDDVLALPLAIGDVVTGAGGERWLEGGLVLREDERVTSVIFLAPEGSERHAVSVFAAPRKDIYWMRPIPLDSPDEPPATIEADGLALRRKARLPVKVERRGSGTPDIGDQAIFATYDGGGRDVAVVLVAERKVHAWVGVRLDEGEYDRLGGGGDA